MLIFKILLRDILLRSTRPPKGVIMMRICILHSYTTKDADNDKNIPFLPTRSTEAMKQEDGGPWTYGTAVGHGSNDDKVRRYRV